MIGTQENAELAVKHFTTGKDFYLLEEGSTRVAYIIDGVVYKVNDTRYHHNDCNAAEYNNYLKMLCNVTPEVRMPEMFLFSVSEGVNVIAAEYIDGQPVSLCFDVELGLKCQTPKMCLTSVEADMLFRAGMNDLCGLNVIKRNGVMYMIDLV